MKIYTCKPKMAETFEENKPFAVLPKDKSQPPDDLYILNEQTIPGLIWCKHDMTRLTSWPPRNKDTSLEICNECGMSQIWETNKAQGWEDRDILAERKKLDKIERIEK